MYFLTLMKKNNPIVAAAQKESLEIRGYFQER